jgi:hypothetical protein
MCLGASAVSVCVMLLRRHFDPCPTQLIAGVPEPDSHEFRTRRSGRSFHAGYVVQVPPSIPPSGAYPFLGAGFGAASLTVSANSMTARRPHTATMVPQLLRHFHHQQLTIPIQ